jgi:hypothetical protein
MRKIILLVITIIIFSGIGYWYYQTNYKNDTCPIDKVCDAITNEKILEEQKSDERFYCQTFEDCTKYRSCSEECVNRNYKKNNPYNGPQCGAPWEFGCKCINNKCEIGDHV